MSNRARHDGDARKRPQAKRAASPRRRWRRRLGALLLVLLLAPVLLVAVLRFVDPPTSAFMLAYRLESGESADFRWKPHPVSMTDDGPGNHRCQGIHRDDQALDQARLPGVSSPWDAE